MKDKLSKLDVVIARRPYLRFPNGTYQSGRTYVDFLVDGKSLAAAIKLDLVSVLTAEWDVSERQKSIRRLLLEEPADFPENRRSLFVCAECGDLGCGAVSLVIDLSTDAVTWRDFGYENNYEPQVHHEGLESLGPFVFGLDSYRRSLQNALELLEGHRKS